MLATILFITSVIFLPSIKSVQDSSTYLQPPSTPVSDQICAVWMFIGFGQWPILFPWKPTSVTPKPADDGHQPQKPGQRPMLPKPTENGQKPQIPGQFPVLPGQKPVTPTIPAEKCKIGNIYRRDFNVTLHKVNPNMTYNCTLEESAFGVAVHNKSPPTTVYELHYNNLEPECPVSPQSYIKTFKWEIDAYLIKRARGFGCFLDIKSNEGNSEETYCIIICHLAIDNLHNEDYE